MNRLSILILLLIGATGHVAPAQGVTRITAPDSVTQALAGPAPVLPARPALTDYLQAAAYASPALRAAFETWRSEVSRAGYSGALPNPEVAYGYFVESVETRVGPQNHRVMLRQMFPWFGTLDAREDAVLRSADAAWHRFESVRQDVFYRVTLAYANYYYLGREVEITRENLELLTFWESVVRARYRVALSTHPDVIKAQVELGTLEDRLLSVERSLEPAQARLRAAVGLPDSLVMPPPDTLDVIEIAAPGNVVRAAVRNNKDLLAMIDRVASEEANVRAQGKQSWPMLSVGVDYIFTGPAVMPDVPDSGKDPFVVNVGATLPLWFGANNARRREAEAKMRAAEYQREDAENELVATVEGAVFAHDDALRKVRLYRDGLIPKAQQSLGASFTAYQAGKTEFLNVLDAQRQLLGFQLNYESARVALATQRARIDLLSGTLAAGE